MTETEASQDKKIEFIPFLCNFVDRETPSTVQRNVDFKNFLRSISLDLSSFKSDKKKVLILSNVNDLDCNVLNVYLAKNDLTYFRINQEDFINNVQMRTTTFHNGESYFEIKLNDDQLLLDDVSLVFLRDFNLSNCSFSLNSFLQKFVEEQWDNFLLSILKKLSCPWINTIKATEMANDRYTVLQLASQLGFNVPHTIISNNAKDLKNFYFNHDGRVISKVLHHHNISSTGKTYSIYSHHVTNADLDLLEKSQQPPTLFQERIDRNKEIRVTIIGNNLFATELVLPNNGESIYDIHRFGVDNVKKRPIKLSNEYEKKCFDLIESLNLIYGTIDIIEGLDGQDYFLEVNSMGDWYWIEKETKQPFTQSLVDLIKNNMQK